MGWGESPTSLFFMKSLCYSSRDAALAADTSRVPAKVIHVDTQRVECRWMLVDGIILANVRDAPILRTFQDFLFVPRPHHVVTHIPNLNFFLEIP